MPIDYSAHEYWETRLSKERDDGFEWLVPSDALLPLVSLSTQALDKCDGSPVKVLHFGCGSSSLGADIRAHVGSTVEVYDGDYASSSLNPRTNAPHVPPLVQVDVLSPQSLAAVSPAGGWDLVIDKSTADAISCGPPHSVPANSTGAVDKEAIQVLCENLAQFTRPGARWISVSYSASRFEFLQGTGDQRWRVLDKMAIKLNATVVEGQQQTTVYQPETGIWAWVMERR